MCFENDFSALVGRFERFPGSHSFFLASFKCQLMSVIVIFYCLFYAYSDLDLYTYYSTILNFKNIDQNQLPIYMHAYQQGTMVIRPRRSSNCVRMSAPPFTLRRMGDSKLICRSESTSAYNSLLFASISHDTNSVRR